jgi:transposase
MLLEGKEGPKMRKSFSPEFMAKVVLGAIKDDITTAELSSKYKVHMSQINNWRKRALEELSEIFRGKRDKSIKDSAM